MSHFLEPALRDILAAALRRMEREWPGGPELHGLFFHPGGEGPFVEFWCFRAQVGALSAGFRTDSQSLTEHAERTLEQLLDLGWVHGVQRLEGGVASFRLTELGVAQLVERVLLLRESCEEQLEGRPPGAGPAGWGLRREVRTLGWWPRLLRWLGVLG